MSITRWLSAIYRFCVHLDGAGTWVRDVWLCRGRETTRTSLY